MNLTRENKLEIYQYVRKTLLCDINGEWTHLAGFCHRLSEALVLKFGHAMEIDPYEESDFRKYFPELYKHKPDSSEENYWFHPGDYSTRLTIIDEVINTM